jgi:hypothetical protein
MWAPNRYSSPLRTTHVGFLDLHAALADRLDFPALQHEAGLVAVLDEVVEKGFLIINNTHEIAKMRASVKLLLIQHHNKRLTNGSSAQISFLGL